MGADTKSNADAWRLWDRVCGDDRVVFVAEPEQIEEEFRSRSRLRSVSPKVWADAYLIAFAAAAGLMVITFDQALKARNTNVLIL